MKKLENHIQSLKDSLAKESDENQAIKIKREIHNLEKRKVKKDDMILKLEDDVKEIKMKKAKEVAE